MSEMTLDLMIEAALMPDDELQCLIDAQAELARLRGIEAVVCAPYGEDTLFKPKWAVLILRRWASEEDSERGEGQGGTFLTNWIRAIADALEAK